MSLLNDALRAAEERQNRPSASGAYVGGTQQAQGGSRILVGLLVVLVLLVVAFAGYWMFLRETPVPPNVVDESEPKAAPADVEESRPRSLRTVTEPEPVQVPEADSAGVQVVAIEASRAQAPEPVSAPEPEPEPARTSAPAQPAETAANTVAGEPSEQAEPEPESESKSNEVSTAGVKNVPETPAAKDRSEARELERLVARGRMTEAESRLAGLIQEQPAPRSRYVVARALLVDGKQDQALNWLPGDVVAQEPKLRLLRARALHANNDLAAATDTLTTRVPPVEDHAEYRVTLATLLQQQGESGEAARHWAELIAWDDSKGAWWVGLAIALEGQGERAGAARAYQQAADLPGLPRSLADYVQQRLRALRAG